MALSDEFIGPVTFPEGYTLAAVANRLIRQGLRVCLIELHDPHAAAALTPALRFDGGPVGSLLDAAIRYRPGYRWELVGEELINTFPVDSILETILPGISVHDRPLADVLTEDLALQRYGISLFQELVVADAPRVRLELARGSIRDALNSIARQIPGSIWRVSGVPDASLLTISTLPTRGPSDLG